MKVSEIGNELKQMYESAPDKEKSVFIHLFGIKYGPIILENRYSSSEIVKPSGIKQSYQAEVSKGIKLSK